MSGQSNQDEIPNPAPPSSAGGYRNPEAPAGKDYNWVRPIIISGQGLQYAYIRPWEVLYTSDEVKDILKEQLVKLDMLEECNMRLYEKGKTEHGVALSGAQMCGCLEDTRKLIELRLRLLGFVGEKEANG